VPFRQAPPSFMPPLWEPMRAPTQELRRRWAGWWKRRLSSVMWRGIAVNGRRASLTNPRPEAHPMPRAWLPGHSYVKQAATTTSPTIVLDARDLVLRRGHQDTVHVGSAGSDGPRSPKAGPCWHQPNGQRSAGSGRARAPERRRQPHREWERAHTRRKRPRARRTEPARAISEWRDEAPVNAGERDSLKPLGPPGKMRSPALGR
jgi:hypothetical protein